MRRPHSRITNDPVNAHDRVIALPRHFTLSPSLLYLRASVRIVASSTSRSPVGFASAIFWNPNFSRASSHSVRCWSFKGSAPTMRSPIVISDPSTTWGGTADACTSVTLSGAGGAGTGFTSSSASSCSYRGSDMFGEYLCVLCVLEYVHSEYVCSRSQWV